MKLPYSSKEAGGEYFVVLNGWRQSEATQASFETLKKAKATAKTYPKSTNPAVVHVTASGRELVWAVRGR